MNTEAERVWSAYEKRLLEGPRHDWHKAECLGLYGYANGRHALVGQETARSVDRDVAAACSMCRRGQECWSKLRAQAPEVLPAMTEAFEALVAQGLQGKALIEAWQRQQRRAGDADALYHPDPYMALTFLHLRVGMEHERRATMN